MGVMLGLRIEQALSTTPISSTLFSTASKIISRNNIRKRQMLLKNRDGISIVPSRRICSSPDAPAWCSGLLNLRQLAFMAKRLPTEGGASHFQHWHCNAAPCAMLSLKLFCRHQGAACAVCGSGHGHCRSPNL
jgi:hypothetical protein